MILNVSSASLGYSDWYQRSDMNGLRSIATRSYDEAIKRGVICVSAMGNEGTQSMVVPADSFYSIAVGSVDLQGNVS
jgi:hypothetical protein